MKRLIISIILLVCIGSDGSAGEKTSSPQRIISLAPNTTEILFALGLGDRIAGVTTFCDYPREAKAKPKIGGMSNPSLEAVVRLKPDLVVATTDGNPKDFVERLRALKIKTFVFTARRLRELPQGIRELGAAVGAQKEAVQLAAGIEQAIEMHGAGVTEQGSGVRGQGAGVNRTAKNSELRTQNSELNKTKVLFIVWPEPLIVAGPRTAMDDAIALLGYENIAHGATTAYPKYSIEEVLRQAPDVLFIGKATGMDMRAVSQGFLKRLSLVPAVRNDKICYVSDNLYRLSPRVVRGIEELAECLK
jgi:iron complex transport system substrate-binding protein